MSRAPRPGSGLLFGAGAYGIWGLFPAFFPLLKPAGAIEILAHRIIWSFCFMAVVVIAVRRLGDLRRITGRTWLLLTLASALISANWVIYVHAVNNGHVVDAALGYFINPLVTVLMGVLVLGEKLRRPQWCALAIGFVAVVVLTIDYGRPPVVALVLAFSFGTYGLAKKSADVGAIESLAFETAVIAPVALVYLVWLGAAGQAHFTGEGPGHVALLVASGAVTAVPLLCFGAAATRVSMTALGLLQYLAPVLQFLIGITVLGESMPPGRWVGFGLVWLALAVFTLEALRHRRRTLGRVAEASAV